ncbi:MAG: DegV family protein [Clostridia bacterium]|nr:DegV family protein [Clostridia bacterium]
MSVRIIIDSTSDITPDIKKRLEIVPLTIRFGTQEYVDGVTITHKQFYEKLIENDELPTTSQASPDAFATVFEKVHNAGDSAVVLTVASGLSGTYQSAMIAAQDYPEIHVMDTKTVAIGGGVLAEMALRYVDEGLNAEQIAAKLERERENVRLVALLDTLEYLKRGGRISKAVAFAGGLLSIKPVVAVQDGEILMLGKARGSRQGNNLLMQEIEKAGGVDFTRPVMLGYTGLSDLLLRKYVEDSAELWRNHCSELPAAMIGSVVGTHAGPGAVAVAFFRA